MARLTESQRKTIQAEAAALGISPSEYLTMILTLSKTIRKTLATADSFDPKSVLEWANNPLLTSLLTGLIGSVKKSGETNSSTNSNSTNSNSNSNPPHSQNPSNPVAQNPSTAAPPVPNAGSGWPHNGAPQQTPGHVQGYPPGPPRNGQQGQETIHSQEPLSYDPWYDWM